MTTHALLTLSQLAIAIGLIIAAVGGYGAYHFKEVHEKQQHDAQKEEDRKTREELRPLIFGPVNWGAQAGYSVEVTEQNGHRRQGLWGFPTVTNEIFRPSKAPQTLFATVAVTNRNPIAAKIVSVGVTVRHLAEPKVDIGTGEMVGGVRNRRFTCTIKGSGVGDFDGRLVDADADYISVDAGGIETLVICVYSEVSGLLAVSPPCRLPFGGQAMLDLIGRLVRRCLFRRAAAKLRTAGGRSRPRSRERKRSRIR